MGDEILQLTADRLRAESRRPDCTARLGGDEFLILVDAGEPCTYSGDSMAMSHRGMEIRHAGFDALVGDLIVAMEKVDVPVRAQNRLLALLAPMHGEIMEAQVVEPL